MVAGMIGAVSGTILVVFLGNVTWAFVQTYSWTVIGPVVGGSLGAIAGNWLRGKPAAILGCISGMIGGLVGAFLAVASAEVYQGRDWTLYGGLYGAAGAAICSVIVSSIGAAIGGIVAHCKSKVGVK
jgi:hypothetical protein